MSNTLTSHQTKSLLSFAKDSAKKSFQKLREGKTFYCSSLKEEIQITKLFFQHVVYKDSRARTPFEIMERILIFPFLSEIINEGKIREIKKREDGIFYQISKQYNSYTLSVVIIKNQKNNFILLSCFKDF